MHACTATLGHMTGGKTASLNYQQSAAAQLQTAINAACLMVIKAHLACYV